MSQTLRLTTTLLPATARLYIEMGSVFAKQLQNGATFIALSHEPSEERIKAKTATLRAEGQGPTYQLKTTHGVYDLAATQRVRLEDGRAVALDALKPGDALHTGNLQNSDGFIFIETGKGLAALHDLVEADMQGIRASLGIAAPSSYHENVVQRVVSVTLGPVAALCALSFDDPTDAPEGHCFLLWPDGTSFGSGIFVY